MTPAEKVYRLYRDNPNPPKRGHLYDHYKRGKLRLMEPSKRAKLAHAAWRAGRDSVSANDDEMLTRVLNQRRT